MVKRLYKEGNKHTTIDDRHEVFRMYESQCTTCKHFHADDYYCRAFPDGIPDSILSGKQKHDNVLKSQVGEYVYIEKE